MRERVFFNRFHAAVLILLVSIALQVQEADAQEFTPIEVIPANPVAGEPITVRYILVGCSAPSDYDGIDMNIDGWIISVDFIPQEVCFPVTREFEVPVPGLPAGQYQVMTYVNYSAKSFPVDPDERTLLFAIDFEVSGYQAVSVDSLGTWGKTILALVLLLTVSLLGLYEKRSIQAW